MSESLLAVSIYPEKSLTDRPAKRIQNTAGSKEARLPVNGDFDSCASRATSRPMMRPIALFLLVVTLVCSGCVAHSDEQSQTSPQNSASATVASTESPTPPTRAIASEPPTGKSLRRNADTLFSGCSGSTDDNVSFAGSVFETGSGKNVPMPPPPVPQGAELVSYACTVISIAAKPRLIYVVATKTPSHGITPESRQSQLYAFDLSSSTPSMVKPVPPDIEIDSGRIQPIANGFVLIGTPKYNIVLFDGNTLDVKAKRPRADNDQAYANFDGYAIASYPNGPYGTATTHFISASDDSELGAYPNTGQIIVTDHGFLVAHYQDDSNKGRTDYFDLPSRQLVEAVAPGYVGHINFDNDVTELPHGFQVSGSNWYSGHQEIMGSQYGNVVLLHGFNGEGSFLTVYDLQARQTRFQLSGDRYRQLNVVNAVIGGKYLFIEKEPDNPVVDYETSEDVASGWRQRAALTLADGWVLVQSGGISLDELRLARGPHGDFDGPWF